MSDGIPPARRAGEGGVRHYFEYCSATSAPSFEFETIFPPSFLLRDNLTAIAAGPPVETVPATTSPRVAKQNGHIVHLQGWHLIAAFVLVTGQAG